MGLIVENLNSASSYTFLGGGGGGCNPKKPKTTANFIFGTVFFGFFLIIFFSFFSFFFSFPIFADSDWFYKTFANVYRH